MTPFQIYKKIEKEAEEEYIKTCDKALEEKEAKIKVALEAYKIKALG